MNWYILICLIVTIIFLPNAINAEEKEVQFTRKLTEQGVIPALSQGAKRSKASESPENQPEESAKPVKQDLPGEETERQAQNQDRSIPTDAKDTPQFIVSIDILELPEDEENALFSGLNTILRTGGTVEYVHQKQTDTIFLFSYSSEETQRELQEKLSESSAIQIAENRRYQVQSTVNDPQYSSQQNLRTIQYPQALTIPRSSIYRPVIAVMDNGVNISDPELAQQIWTNTAEIAGNGIDDDGNGYIDDIHGCNFVRYSDNNPSISSSACLSTNLYTGGVNHGTQVAQVAAAETDNATGIAGVCPYCRIMVLDVDDSSSAFLSDIILAINYAVTMGADVINFSYASTCPFDQSADVLNTLINSITTTSNTSWVQAAGNTGSLSQESCESNCGSNLLCSSSKRNQAYYYIDGKNAPNTLIIAATDNSNRRAGFSNFDEDQPVIAIAAPGTDIPVFVNGVPVSLLGTSFATPQISGAVGFALSYTKPWYAPSPAEIRSLLRNTGTRISTDKNISGKLLNMADFTSVINAEGTVYNTNKLYVSRFYSDTRRAHFFTGNQAEARVVRDTLVPSVYRFEGIAFYAYLVQASQSMPVFRFYNTRTQSHFYTINEAEKDVVETQLAKDGWTYEGISFYVYPAEYTGGSTITVYRFYNLETKRHFFTTNAAERDILIANFPANSWRYEGEAWKALVD